MTQNDQKPQWAPKVPQAIIRRLYTTDAQGIVDDELIDRVGWALWERCDSILTVTAAHHGQVRCPSCGIIIVCNNPGASNEQLECGSCDWRLPWSTYHQTYRGKQLFGANAVDIFQSFHQAFPNAQAAKTKMLLIDQLIHAFHISLGEIGRPVAANLIVGTLAEVIHFLDALTNEGTTASGMSSAREQWRHTLAAASWSQPFIPTKRPSDD
jgi:predicted RNA-binding Zn-ribbon protein involved in translation (DUF1610 family)